MRLTVEKRYYELSLLCFLISAVGGAESRSPLTRETMRHAQGSSAAGSEMKKRGGARKGAGHPRGGKKPEPAVAVEDREVMTLQEVADYLHCHYETAHRLVRQGEIPSFRVGGGWRFLKSEVDEWITKGGARRPSEEPAVKPRTKSRNQKPAAKKPAPRKGQSRK